MHSLGCELSCDNDATYRLTVFNITFYAVIYDPGLDRVTIFNKFPGQNRVTDFDLTRFSILLIFISIITHNHNSFCVHLNIVNIIYRNNILFYIHAISNRMNIEN